MLAFTLLVIKYKLHSGGSGRGADSKIERNGKAWNKGAQNRPRAKKCEIYN